MFAFSLYYYAIALACTAASDIHALAHGLSGDTITLARRNWNLRHTPTNGEWIVNWHAFDKAYQSMLKRYSVIDSRKYTSWIYSRHYRRTAALKNISQSSTILLSDQVDQGVDSEYDVFASINVGSTSLKFLFDVDTGSSDLWVPSTACTSKGCINKTLFPVDIAKQTLVNSNFNISYGSGKVSGFQGIAKVTIGNFTVSKQSIGFCDFLSSDFEQSQSDALVGLAFDSLSTVGKPTFMSNLIKSGMVSENSFTMSLNRDSPGLNKGGTLTLGGTGQFNETQFVTVDVDSTSGFWLTTMDSFSINGHVETKNSTVIIDSGTTLILAPLNIAKKFYALLGGLELSDSPGSFVAPCNKLKTATVNFIFAGQSFTINSKDLNVGQDPQHPGQCAGAIIGANLKGVVENSNTWILGDTFIKSVAAIKFNMGKIGDGSDATIGFLP